MPGDALRGGVMDAVTELVCGGPCTTELTDLEMIGRGEAWPVSVRRRTPKDGRSGPLEARTGRAQGAWGHPRIAVTYLEERGFRMVCPDCGYPHTLYPAQLAEMYAAAVEIGQGKRRAFARRTATDAKMRSFGSPALRR